jgi:hypothetical protein
MEPLVVRDAPDEEIPVGEPTTVTPDGNPEMLPTITPLNAGLVPICAVTVPPNPRKIERLPFEVICAEKGSATFNVKIEVSEYPPAVAVMFTV